MASTSAVTAQRCRDVMRRNGVDDLHSLTLHTIDRGVFKPTAVRMVPSTGPGAQAAAGAPSSLPNLALALDGTLSTGVWLSLLPDSDISIGLDLGALLVPSLVRLALCGPDLNASRVGGFDDTAIWLARIEGSNRSSTSGYQDLGPLLVQQPLLHLARGQYLTHVMSRNTQPVRWLRIRLPPADNAAPEAPGICLAEIEVHQGEVTRELSSIESGASSFDLDMDLLHHEQLKDTAYMLKCAAYRLFPVETSIVRTEVVLPEQAGLLLSTGNLGDITKGSGNLSSLSVLDDMVMHGAVSLGDPTDARAWSATLELNSILTEPLRFEGKIAGNGQATVMPEKAGAAWSISLPDAASGSLMTSGEIPALQTLSVLSAGSFKQRLDALDHVTLGTKLDPQPLTVELPVDGREPLRFAGRLPRDGRQTDIIVSAASSAASLLMLPDASGTVQVSSDLPSARRNATFHQHVKSQGGSVFDGKTMRMGRALDSETEALRLSLEHARLSTPTGLHFGDHTSSDGGEMPSIALGMEEPARPRSLWLPDDSGTILTSEELANTPFESLRMLQQVSIEGHVNIESQHVSFGSPASHAPSYLSINSRLSGQYPLSFDCDMPGAVPQAGQGHACLSIERPLSAAQNTITLPDTSGTVLTTGNLPNPLVTDVVYTVTTDMLIINSARALSLGSHAESQTEESHSGSFVFVDSLPLPRMSEPSSSCKQVAATEKDNQFVAVVRGGVKFETGKSGGSGKALGCMLAAGASAWSSLSDKQVKTNVSRVDAADVKQRLLDLVPVSTWNYALGGRAESEGISLEAPVRRLGPMAQDMHGAFSLGSDETRIDNIDADGVLLAALQGAAHHQEQVSSRVAHLEARLQELRAAVRAQEEILATQQADLLAQAQLVANIQKRTGVSSRGE